MTVEEKMKKNKNCELSHMVRPAGSLEVYKQKQNILFISGCVEHRRFKVTWARLWGCSGVCTAGCSCQAYARPSAWLSAWAYVWPNARVGRMHGPMVCDDGLDGRTVRLFERLGSDIRFARLIWARGSVGRGARLGRDTSTVWPRRTD